MRPLDKGLLFGILFVIIPGTIPLLLLGLFIYKVTGGKKRWGK